MVTGAKVILVGVDHQRTSNDAIGSNQGDHRVAKVYICSTVYIRLDVAEVSSVTLVFNGGTVFLLQRVKKMKV